MTVPLNEITVQIEGLHRASNYKPNASDVSHIHFSLVTAMKRDLIAATWSWVVGGDARRVLRDTQGSISIVSPILIGTLCDIS
jgi:hypothetical protein